MKFSDYQRRSRMTAMYPRLRGATWVYPALGLTGEAGEVSEKLKKVLRDKGGIMEQEDVEAIAKELGDVLWYVAQVCTELRLQMDEVALLNLQKLESRKERDVITGNGDDR